MQGFFVHVTDSPTDTYPVSATLGTTNEVRVTDFSQQFYKSPLDEYFTLLRLNATYDGSIRNDETVIYFENVATEAYDNSYDALKLMNTDPSVPNLYSISSDEKPLSINGVSATYGSDVLRIPLGFNLENEGWITLSLTDIEETILTGYVYLVDMDKRKRVNLLDKNEYRFQASAGRNDSRFHLVFSNSVIDDPAVIFNDLFSVNQSGGTVKIKMNLAIGEIGDIKVSTVTGQTIETQFVSENDVIEINGIKSSGLYLISFYSKEGIFTKKVLIQK
ncbi:T9SS type A sorting domain-containing protein [Gillisia marina]|uniref:T9SS type A sorting domain-containing protein n=1 Tax=Gillisia marina TaxID=1167637 RepID=UPI0002D79620|nr:T9SS type A sorting domain-containing protein [Gillisia marina]